jgi:hypothetical protein
LRYRCSVPVLLTLTFAGTLDAASAPLPDSILAQVGAHRRISTADFRRAWAQVAPPERPDSLTPQTAREFLELLIGKEALAEAALRETWVWTHAESVQFGALSDRLTLQAALEEPLAEARQDLRRAGAETPNEAEAGLVARDSAVARMHTVFDDAVLARLARAYATLPKPSRDSGLFAQLRVMGRNPIVDSRDSLSVTARTTEGDYRVCDLLDWWKTLNPLARPRVETVEQVRDLVRNGVFERKLRRLAAARDLEHRPDIAEALARQREFLSVTHLVQREVYDSLKADSLTLLAFYRRNPDEYTIPTRVRCLRLVLDTRADAGRMAVRLRDPVQAESLAAKSERQRLGYALDLTAAGDSALFARVLRADTGAVIGPDSVADGWAVARVQAVLPPQPRTFGEVRGLVEHAWYGTEGERRMVLLIERLRRSSHVLVNERPLARLAAP